jgi:hypothetical protein
MKNQSLLVLALVLLLSGTAVRADGPHISANQYDPDSTSNPYGRYGSPYSPDSVNNPYGQGVRLTAPPAHAQAAPVVNVWAAPPAVSPTWDGAGLDTLGAPGSGLQFKTDALPAAQAAPTVEPAPAPLNTPGYVDPYKLLDEYRAQEAKK